MAEPLALMVVSDLLMRQTVEESLRAAGYRAVGAAGNVRLRSRLAADTPSVCVLDLETGGLDLDDALAALTAAGVPTLGFCGHTLVELRDAGLAAGCARVATRGEIAKRLDRLVAELAGPASGTVPEDGNPG